MVSTKWISKKVAVVGSHAVGKTSLITRFVYKKFPENYLTTIGLKVDKKTVVLETYQVDMIIWDIAGRENMARIPQYYLQGCSGVIFVCDLSRPKTFQQLETQLAKLRQTVGHNTVLLIAANKSDLLKPEDLEKLQRQISVQLDVITSAKSGENVEYLFTTLAKKLIEREAN